MSDLPLSKTLDLADFDQLTEELAIVDQHFEKATAQHPMRRWEYAMALRAQAAWWALQDTRVRGRRSADVGGAGSPFYLMSGADHTYVIDPKSSMALDQYFLGDHPWVFPQVFCLSVLEHVDDLDRFLYHLSCLVAPGGLLFLTMDYCEDLDHVVPPDSYHFHWMRKRIFNATQHDEVRRAFLPHFQVLGSIDYSWSGPQVYDYTFASLALVKRP